MGKWSKIPEPFKIHGRSIHCVYIYSNFSFLQFQPNWSKPKYLPNILVPQDAYNFVTAMDEVIRQLPVEEPTHAG
jgi:hypothetical protein